MVQLRAVETRERILEAAVRSLVDHGYAASTTLRIQELAGVSRGRLLHHFPNRTALLVAATRHLFDSRRLEGIPAGSGDAARDPHAAIRRAVETVWSVFFTDTFVSTVELWTAARTDAELAAALAPGEREIGRILRRSLRSTFGPEIAARPGFEEAGRILLSSMRGTAITYAFDSRNPATEPLLDHWATMMARMTSLAEPASEPTQHQPHRRTS